MVSKIVAGTSVEVVSGIIEDGTMVSVTVSGAVTGAVSRWSRIIVGGAVTGVVSGIIVGGAVTGVVSGIIIGGAVTGVVSGIIPWSSYIFSGIIMA